MDSQTVHKIKDAVDRQVPRHPDLPTRYTLEFVYAPDGHDHPDRWRTLFEVCAPTPLDPPPAGAVVFLQGVEVVVRHVAHWEYVVTDGVLHVNNTVLVDAPPAP